MPRHEAQCLLRSGLPKRRSTAALSCISTIDTEPGGKYHSPS